MNWADLVRRLQDHRMTWRETAPVLDTADRLPGRWHRFPLPGSMAALVKSDGAGNYSLIVTGAGHNERREST